MKKLILVLFSFVLLSCSQEEKKPVNYAIFSGNIENLKGSNISVRNSQKIIKKIAVNNDGSFLDTLKNIASGYYTFGYANESSKIYLQPGFNLHLYLDPKEFDESIKYTGKGSNENNYLAQKFLNNEKLGTFLSYKYIGSLDEDDFVKKMDSIKKLQVNFLNNYNGLDSNFKNLEQADVLYGWANRMLDYELFKRYVSKNDEFKVSQNFPKITKDLNLEDESLLSVENYKMFLKKYYEKQIPDTENIDFQTAYLSKIASEVNSQKIKNFLLYTDAKYGISYTENLQNYYDIFMANSTNEEHKKDISEKYNKLIKLSKGSPSPKFVAYENFKGGTTSLDDLKGKYVYIDVWATWCGPCKREIPFLKEISKKYQNKNITFVSMSIDKKKAYDTWRKMVKDKELEGIQLFAPNDWKSDFVTAYGIMGIPRFILVDPNGNIVKANAPRPSSKELINLFDKLKI